jgi:hypothetical protein
MKILITACYYRLINNYNSASLKSRRAMNMDGINKGDTSLQNKFRGEFRGVNTTVYGTDSKIEHCTTVTMH